MASVPQKQLTDIVTDFLVTAPSLDELAGYRLPDNLKERAHVLLEKNRVGTLTEREQAEMEEFRVLLQKSRRGR